MDIADGSSLLINSIIFLVSLGFCSLFSFLETSMMALRLFQLKELAQRTGSYQALFRALEEDPNRLLNAILIAYNLVNTIAATAGTFVIERLLSSLPSSIGYSIGVLIITAAILIFGDIIPKNLVKFRGERFFASTLWLTNLTYYALYPFVTLLGKFTDVIVRLITGPVAREEAVTSEKEIQFLISYIDEKGLMDPEKTSMLQSVFRLSTTPVKDIMVPAPDIVMIDSKKTVQDAYQLFNKCQFSRIPVYKEDHNNIIGMLHIKDIVPVIAQKIEKPLKEFFRPILFIPESIKVNELLKAFKNKHMHIAIIINEHGSVTGLVTLEDVLEEIVGEIHDEYEAIIERIMPLQKGNWLVDARTELDKLEKILKISFESESKAATLGGFLVEQFQHLPEKGERLHYKGYTFQVQQVTNKKIVRVLIFQTEQGVVK
ncbi:MAG: hemolysin family protein [Candidatus Dependentiae bacterium]|nr:hemolysin family protein [Candidatus Dependentiae bacterium]